jgi:hypothetical protein
MVLGASLVLLRAGADPGLAAASNQGRTDADGDGLSDQQELVLGTLPFRADSDRDTYSDLEELARGSEPMNPSVVPESAPLGLGSCASQENGYVRMLTAVYVEDAPLSSLRLDFGLIYRGRALRLAMPDFHYSTGFLLPGRDSGDTLAVLEVGVPARLVHRLERLHLYAIVGSSNPAGERLVTTQSLASVGGIVASIEQRRIGVSTSGGGSAQGVIYRPLASDDQITASGWEAGKICFQRTAAVGSNGVSIVFEVDGADCIPMDTQCNPSECAAGVGSSLDLPDPAALIGG